MLPKFKIDISHQEMSRITQELEKTYNLFAFNDEGPTGVEWLPVEGVANILREELGYEDMPEFEDALKGSFEDFIQILPHVELKREARNEVEKLYFKIKPDLPKEEWKPRTLTFKITSTKDLWRVCYKSKHATVKIPELEYEASADGVRTVDSIYNHIAQAVFNLGNYVKESGDLESERNGLILDTVYALNAILDVGAPWTWVVEDPSGVAEIYPMEGVEVTEGIAPEQPAGESPNEPSPN